MKSSQKLLKIKLLTISLWAALAFSTFAHAQGDKAGGGGDASEFRVDEIRAHILKWISFGGAQEMNTAQGGDFVD